MVRKYLVLIFLLNKSFAQDLTFNWSDSVITKGDIRFSGIHESNIYAVQSKDNKIAYTRRYNSKLQLLNETINEFLTTTEPYSYLISFVSDSHLVHIKYFFSKKEDVFKLVKTTEAFGLNGISDDSALLNMKANRYSFIEGYYSSDRSKLLLCNYYSNVKTITEYREFAVIDAKSGNLIHKGVFSFNYIVEQLQDISVDNKGNVYFPTIESKREGNRLTGKVKTKGKLTSFLTSGEKKEFDFSYPGSHFTGLNVIQGEGNYVYIAGITFDEDTRATRLSGGRMFIKLFNCDKSQSTDSAYIHIPNLFPAKRLSEDDRIPYTIRNIYKRNSGGYVIVAEQYQIIAGQYGVKKKYNDIACIRLKEDFTIDTVFRIPKLQFGSDNASVLCNYLNDTLYILYSDHQNNLSATVDNLKYPANNNDKNGLFLVTIDSIGNYKKEMLYGYNTGQPMPILQYCVPIDNRTFFLSAVDRIGILKFTNK